MTDTMPISREAWEAYRSAFRALGPRHRMVDRWRYDLDWSVPEPVVADWLAPERAKLVERAGHA
jgi:hypothetical protein